MKYEQANQPLHRIPFPPLIQNRRCSCELQIDVLQSLKVLRPGYWEDLQFNNTSKLASRGLFCFVFSQKEKVASQRERKREKRKKKKRERERILPLIYTESVLPDVLSRSSEMVEKARVEDKGGDSASGERSHIHHHLFVYIEATNHLDESAKGRNRKENL